MLVIDDDAEVRRCIAAALEGEGHQVLQSAQAERGLQLFDECRPELVICDLHQSDLPGFELLRQLSERDSQTPILVVTAADQMSDVVEALRMGASDYLLKPLNDMAVIAHAVRRCLDRFRLHRENQRIRERLEQVNGELQNHLKALRDDQAAGHQVQLNMLPPSPWHSGSLSFRQRVIPSFYLSGDFVDYFRVSDTQVAFYLADVSGHGVASAFVTVLLKFMTTRLLYEQRRDGRSGPLEFKPSEVLGHVNRSLINCRLGKHVTILGGVIDESSSSLTYCVAGHLPLPLLYSNGRAQYLQGRGQPVGLFEQAVYEDRQITLPGEFSLIFCSDGVLECLPGSTLKEREARLPVLVEQSAGDLDSLLGLLGLAEEAALPDDLSVLCVSRNLQ